MKRFFEIDRENMEEIGMRPNKNNAPYGTELMNAANAARLVETYDHIILAIGSRPFVPPFEGADLSGSFVFPAIDDSHDSNNRMKETIEADLDPWKKAAVSVFTKQFQGPQLKEVVGEVHYNG